jgi:hypothetical protein
MFARCNPSGARTMAFLNSFEVFEFFPGTVRIPRFGPVSAGQHPWSRTNPVEITCPQVQAAQK